MCSCSLIECCLHIICTLVYTNIIHIHGSSNMRAPQVPTCPLLPYCKIHVYTVRKLHIKATMYVHIKSVCSYNDKRPTLYIKVIYICGAVAGYIET